MKKFAVIFTVIFVAFVVNSFACDYCPDPVTGQGHFDATVIIPIAFTYVPTDGDADLGTFVVCATPYTVSSNIEFQFVISGQPNYNFHYKIVQDLTDVGSSITLTWRRLIAYGGATLTAGSQQLGNLNETGGKFTIRADPGTFTTGTTPGAKVFNQTVYANYQGGL